jgi:hypothetical protein
MAEQTVLSLTLDDIGNMANNACQRIVFGAGGAPSGRAQERAGIVT